MATLIQMVCEECAYESSELRFGPLFSDPTIVVPAFNLSTGEIVEADVENEKHPSLVFYTDKRLQSKKVKGVDNGVVSAYDYSINNCGNFCPKCNGYTLSVKTLAMID